MELREAAHAPLVVDKRIGEGSQLVVVLGYGELVNIATEVLDHSEVWCAVLGCYGATSVSVEERFAQLVVSEGHRRFVEVDLLTLEDAAQCFGSDMPFVYLCPYIRSSSAMAGLFFLS